MTVKIVISLFAFSLIGFAISPSYSQEIISCNGFESCPTNDGDAIVALEARIAALEASRPYLYDAEGKKIGLYIGDTIPQWLSANPEGNIPLAQVITNDGYTMWINWRDGGLIAPEWMTGVLSGGTLASVEMYLSHDCSGPAYAGPSSPLSLSTLSFRGGNVVSLAGGKIAKTGVTVTNIFYESSKNAADQCVGASPTQSVAVPIEAYANPSDFNLDANLRFKIPLKIKMG